MASEKHPVLNKRVSSVLAEHDHENLPLHSQADLEAARQSAFDAGLERAALIICAVCQRQRENPETYKVGPAILVNGDWVHLWNENSETPNEFAQHCFAAAIRSRIGQQER